ncbi:MAG TPA: STAS domain-containing protein [Terracidiphilus sp.]|jgi:anti-sigma B factor antagonist|nr:STAS domain-containing protein [Terracidiphilus sp.]
MPEAAAVSVFSFDVERKGTLAIVRCHGRLVAGVADRLYAGVSRLIPDSKRIVLDLDDLSHMDSMGLGAVVRLYVSAKSTDCCLELVNLGKGIRHLLGVTNLLSVLTTMCENGISLRF